MADGRPGRVFVLTTGLDRRYLVVLGAWMVQFTIVGMMFAYGLFFKSLEEEYGWSRTMLSACSSLSFFMMGVLASFGGHLADRYGPRIVLAFTGICYGAGYLLMSQVSMAWQMFAIFGLFVALGMATHDVVTLSTVAHQFQRRRGLMTAVVKVGTALGQISVPVMAGFLIASTDWRSALLILGSGSMIILLLGAGLMKRPPLAEAAAGEASGNGASLQQARRDPIFWMICAIQFAHFTTLTTIPLHIVVHGMDLGMNPAVAATLLSVMAGASIVGRLTVGGSVDRIGGRRAYILCFVPLITSLVLFIFIPTPWLLYGAVAIYGFGHGGFYPVLSPIVAEYFGLRSHGAIFGVVVFFGTIGGALGLIMAGSVFDIWSSYGPAFGGLAALAAIGLVLAFRLPAPDRQRFDRPGPVEG